MKNNTVTAYSGVEVYTNKITELADQYINYELDEERKQEIYNNSSMFIAGNVNMLGTVWYGTTPEERSGDLEKGTLSLVNTGVSIYTYTTEHPVNTHCVVSEIVLPSYENMDSVFVMKVA